MMQMYMTYSTRFENQHKNLFEILRNNTGLLINRLTIEQIANFIQSIKNYKVTLPSWCTKELLNELFEVADYYWMVSCLVYKFSLTYLFILTSLT